MTFVGQHASFKGRNLRSMPTVPNGENVTYIDLSDNPITSFNQFISYPNLRFLCIDNTKIVSFHYAPELPMLEEFTCRGTSLSCSQYLQLMTVIVFGDRMKFVNGVKIDQRTWMLGRAARAEYRKHLIEGFVFLKIDPIKMINNETRQRKSIFNDLSKLISKENVQSMTRSNSSNAIPSNRTNPKNFTQQKEQIDQQRPEAKAVKSTPSNDDVLVSYANAKQNVSKTEKKLKSQFSLMSNRILASTVDQRSMAAQQNAIIEAHAHRRKHHTNGKTSSDNTAQQPSQNQENNNNSNKRKKRSSDSKQEDNYDDKFKNIQRPTKHNSSFDLTTHSKSDNLSRIPKGTKPPLPPNNQNRKQNRNSLNLMIYPPSKPFASSSSTSSSSSSSTDENQLQQHQQQLAQGHRKRPSRCQSDPTNSIQSNRHSESMPDLAQYHRQHRHHREQEEVVQDEEEAENFEFEPRPGFDQERPKHNHQPPVTLPSQPQPQLQYDEQQEDEAHLGTPKRRQRRGSNQAENAAQNEAEMDGHQQNHHIRRRASQQPQTEKVNETEIKRQRSSDPFVSRPPIPLPPHHHVHTNQGQMQGQIQPLPIQDQIPNDQLISATEQHTEPTPISNAGEDADKSQFVEEEEEEVESTSLNEQPPLPQQPSSEVSSLEAATQPLVPQFEPEKEAEAAEEEEKTERNSINNSNFTSNESQSPLQQPVTDSQTQKQPQKSDTQIDSKVGGEGENKEEKETEKKLESNELEFVGANSHVQKSTESKEEVDENEAISESVKRSSPATPPPLPPSTQPSVSFVSPPLQEGARRTVRINIPHDLSAISENSPIFLSVNDYSSDGDDGMGGLLSEDSCAPQRNNDSPSSIVLELLPEDFSSDDTSRRKRNNAVASFPTNSD